MSYDINLLADLGAGLTSLGLLDWNYTSNCAPMWRKAMSETDGLAGMDGMKAGEAAEVLRKGLRHMVGNRADYEALNPENGWGDFVGQLEALSRLLSACTQAPEAIVVVSH